MVKQVTTLCLYLQKSKGEGHGRIDKNMLHYYRSSNETSCVEYVFLTMNNQLTFFLFP